MSKKKPTTITREALEERQSAFTAREQELSKVRKRNVKHEADRDTGALDYDAPGHLQDEHLEQALTRWLDAQRPHLDEARKVHESFVLAEKIGDPHARREALGVKRAATVEGIRSLLADYASEVEAYNAELTGHIGTARRAGLIEEQADPTLPVLMGGGEHGHPRRLVVEGEHFVTLTADADKIIQEARR